MTAEAERNPDHIEKSADQDRDRSIQADVSPYSGPCDLHPDETE